MTEISESTIEASIPPTKDLDSGPTHDPGGGEQMSDVRDPRALTTDRPTEGPMLPPPPPPPPRPNPSRSSRRGPIIVMGVLAVAGLAAGAGVWAGASSSDEPELPSNTTTTTTVTGPPVGKTVMDLDELVPGQCLNDPSFDEPAGIVASVTIADCAHAHDIEVAEVFDVGNEPGAEYPGDTALFEAAGPRCEKVFAKYVGANYYASELEFGVYYPGEAGWVKYDDRWVVCYVFDPSFEQLTASVAGSGR